MGWQPNLANYNALTSFPRSPPPTTNASAAGSALRSSQDRDRADRTQAAFKKVNSELKRLKSQFSKAKRENEILKQVKDTLSKRLQVEEQRTKELQRESQRSRKDSASTSQYESEIRELRTKLAIAEAEREAAQSLANLRVRHERMYFLSDDEETELCFRWVLLYWYWSAAEKLQICKEQASANAARWLRSLRRAPGFPASGAFSLGDVSDLLLGRREDRPDGDGRGGAGSERQATDGRTSFTLHDLITAECSLRSLHESELDRKVHTALAERTRAQILPTIRDLGNPLAAVSLDSISMDSGLDSAVCFTYDYVCYLQVTRMWLAYVWGKAREKKVEPHLSAQRHELWRKRAGGELTSRCASDVREATKELGALQVEAQIRGARATALLLQPTKESGRAE